MFESRLAEEAGARSAARRLVRLQLLRITVRAGGAPAKRVLLERRVPGAGACLSRTRFGGFELRFVRRLGDGATWLPRN